MEDSYVTPSHDGGSNVPVFLLKLVTLLDDANNHPYVDWTQAGTSFIVKDQVQFSKIVLPKYFKHNKFASFVRQLNMYGFRKITSLTQAGMSPDKDEVEFYHFLFIRGEDQLLSQIKRKVNKPDTLSRTSDDVEKVLSDVKHMKSRQNSITERLSELKHENEDLWQEVVSLRQKHAHQQKVVNKLIQFLVNLVHQTGMGVKRKQPLMIADSSSSAQPPSPKYRKQTIYVEDNAAPLALEPSSVPTVSFPVNAADGKASENQQSVSGPYITEVTGVQDASGRECTREVFPSVNLGDINQAGGVGEQVSESPSQSEYPLPGTVSFPDELHNFIQQQPHLSNMAAPQVQDQQGLLNQPSRVITGDHPSDTRTASPYEITPYNSAKSSRLSPADLNSHVDLMQNNIENIQDLLFSNDQVQLDYGLIQELFSTSPDIMPTANDRAASSKAKSAVGSELVLHSSSEPRDTEGTADTDLGDITSYL